ncbi:MAG: tyrosine-type recombinase/integrase [Acidiferrobacterales bacterium]
MGRPTMRGIYPANHGTWCVDKVWKGERLRLDGFRNYAEAETWLIAELDKRRQAKLFGVRRKVTFEEAAAYYLEIHQEKVSLEEDIYHLKRVMPYIGHLVLNQVHNGTLRTFIEADKTPVKVQRADGSEEIKVRSNKTVNLALGIVRRILNLAARDWRDDNGMSWLGTPPLITLLPLIGFQREPQPLTWADQRRLLPKLPTHLARMVLFDLQTGARDAVVCGLRWDWEIKVPELGISVFAVPREKVKGRRRVRYVVCNSVAQSIIESVRGNHPEYVFVYQGHPIETMNNSAWQRVRHKVGLSDLHVHDLRHTVGMRLREAGVPEHTVADVLWHTRAGMTAHYSVVQAKEIVDALERITSEAHRQNRTLGMIAREAQGLKGGESPRKVPGGAGNG